MAASFGKQTSANLFCNGFLHCLPVYTWNMYYEMLLLLLTCYWSRKFILFIKDSSILWTPTFAYSNSLFLNKFIELAFIVVYVCLLKCFLFSFKFPLNWLYFEIVVCLITIHCFNRSTWRRSILENHFSGRN